MKRTIVNIDKGFAHLYESMREPGIDDTEVEIVTPPNYGQRFDDPNTSWAYLASDEE